jgi:hypothetical protein
MRKDVTFNEKDHTNANHDHIVHNLRRGSLSAFSPAQAGPNRTWVSGHGTDSGACALAAPCWTFAFALTQTAAGGEIDVLDPAGYGTVTITKSISIVNDGVGVAAIGASSGNAITINAGASDFHLRGLTIEGLGTGTNGIFYSGGSFGGTFAIENCVIRDFPTAGIFVQPTGSAVISGVFSKVITNNNGVGIVVNGTLTTGASLNVTIVDREASNNGIGINAGAQCRCQQQRQYRTFGTDESRSPGRAFGGHGEQYWSADAQWRHSIQLRQQRHRRKHHQQHGRSDHDPHALTSSPRRSGRLQCHPPMGSW